VDFDVCGLFVVDEGTGGRWRVRCGMAWRGRFVDQVMRRIKGKAFAGVVGERLGQAADGVVTAMDQAAALVLDAEQSWSAASYWCLAGCCAGGGGCRGVRCLTTGECRVAGHGLKKGLCMYGEVGFTINTR